MRRFVHSNPGRLLAIVLAILVSELACVPGEPLEPEAGVPEFQRPGLVAVPGGHVNAAGGNLVIGRRDLFLDTPMGVQAIDATYHSATGRWHFAHEARYDGALFVDPLGTPHDVTGLAPGEAIPGTGWIVVDADTIRTRGGLDHHFRSNGSLDHVRWATLDYPRTTFSAGEIAHCLAPGACSVLFRLAVDAEGRLLSVSDERTGRIADYTYDGAGRLVAARSPLATEQDLAPTRYEYAIGGSLVAVVTPDGERIEYGYASGRVVSVTEIGAGDPRHTFEYASPTPALDYATLHTNPLGARTRYRFDAERRLLATDRLDTAESETLDWVGHRPTRHTDAAGVATRFAWEGERLATLTEASGNAVEFTWAPGGLNFAQPFAPAPGRIEDSLGLIEEWSHDAFGRPIERSVEGETVWLAYSGTSLVEISGDAIPTISYPRFGAHGHWLELRLGGNVADQRAFSPAGDPTVMSLARREGGHLSWRFDADRRLVGVQVAGTDETAAVVDTAEIGIHRRADGRITRIGRPGGGDHEIVYDALGRPIEIRERVDAAWQVTLLGYDAAGNVTSLERPNGMREEVDYDPYSRPIRRRALRDGLLFGVEAWLYSHGRIIVRGDSTRGAQIHAHDGAGRRIATVHPLGEREDVLYDLRSRPIRRTYSLPDQGVVADLGFEYDGRDRLVRTIDHLSGDVLVERAFAGSQLERLTYANGVTRELEHDAEGRFVGAVSRDGSALVIETTTVARAIAFAPIREELSTQTLTALASSREEYDFARGGSFQPAERLVGKRILRWSAGGASVAHAWDPLSNPVSAPGGGSFTYNGEANRLLSATTANGEVLDYEYDEAGYVTRRAGVALAWTATGRLASFGSASIEWDMAGRPIRSNVGGAVTEYALFSGLVAGTLAAPGTLDLGDVTLSLATSARLYRHRDFRSQVSFVTDDSGAVVSHYQYGAYGVDRSWGDSENRRTFEESVEVSSIMFMGARMYDPAVGRFLSQDPRLQLENQYAYTLGNPIHYEDRNGREAEGRESLALGSAIVGATVAVVLVGAVVVGGAAGLSAPLLVSAIAANTVVQGVVNLAIAIDILTGATESRFPRPVPPDTGGSDPPAGQSKTVEVSIDPSIFAAPESAPELPSGSIPPTCSPTRLTEVRVDGLWLGVLVWLNALLGLLWLGRRKGDRT